MWCYMVHLTVFLLIRNVNCASPAWAIVDGRNAVDGCGLNCTTIGPFHCVGSKSNAAECEATCQGSSNCSIWTYSSSSKHCWWRTDGVWTLAEGSGDTAGCRGSGPHCVPGCPVGVCPMASEVTVGPALPQTVSAMTPAVTLDWWVHEDKKYGYQWGNASILVLDLQRAGFLTLAKGLAGGVLRLGGSPLDSIIYAFDDEREKTCERGATNDNAGGTQAHTCSQVGLATYGCLTRQRWLDLLHFAADSGLRMVFGLNTCRGRAAADKPMDFSNIQELLTFTASKAPKEVVEKALHGFEFGNEVCGRGVTDRQWGEDASKLSKMIKTTFTAAGFERIPTLIGPDCALAPGVGVLDAVDAGVLSAFTYHQYPQCQPPTDGSALDGTCVRHVNSDAKEAAAAVAAANKRLGHVEAWAGETAVHTASGGNFGTYMATFRSSLYYAWQLTSLPADGVPLAARQCLIGGNYGLLNHTTFLPNPDYFIAWAVRQLLDHTLAGAAVPATAEASPAYGQLLTSAFRQEGGSAVVLCMVNLASSSSMNISFPSPPDTVTRQEWHFHGQGGVDSTTVEVNGAPLLFHPSDQLPAFDSLARVVSAGEPIVLAASSVVFVAWA